MSVALKALTAFMKFKENFFSEYRYMNLENFVERLKKCREVFKKDKEKNKIEREKYERVHKEEMKIFRKEREEYDKKFNKFIFFII